MTYLKSFEFPTVPVFTSLLDVLTVCSG